MRPTHVTPILTPPIHLCHKISIQIFLINSKRNNYSIFNFKRTNPSPDLRYVPNSFVTKTEGSRHPIVHHPVDVQVRAADSCSRYLDDGVCLVDNYWLGEVDDTDAVGGSLSDDGAHCGA